MPTARGLGLLMLSAGAYVGGRLVGTYELYLAAVAFAAVLLTALLLVRLSGARLGLRRDLRPGEPTAGDSAEMRFHLSNRSWLPTTALRLIQRVPGMHAADDLVVDVSPIRPHGLQVADEPVPPLRRGAFLVPPALVTFTDPLGVARRRRPLGGEMHVTVLPRIVPLLSCAFFGRGWRTQGRRSRPSAAPASSDLRGVRPHQPGEPLSHIDWKSTAKTGALMLREMEDPGRTEVILVLDGTRSVHVGEPPDDTFETAVNVVGSIGDFSLREGLSVSLLRHEEADRHLHFEPAGHSRRELLTALAEAKADAIAPLGACIRTHRALLRRSLVTVVVSPSLDRETIQELMALAERGIPVFLGHIAAPSFVAGQSTTQLDPRERSILLQLQAAGIPSLTIRKGDDLRTLLAAPEAAETSTRLRSAVSAAVAAEGGGR